MIHLERQPSPPDHDATDQPAQANQQPDHLHCITFYCDACTERIEALWHAQLLVDHRQDSAPIAVVHHGCVRAYQRRHPEIQVWGAVDLQRVEFNPPTPLPIGWQFPD